MKHKKSFKKNYCATETALMQSQWREREMRRKIAKVFIFNYSIFLSLSASLPSSEFMNMKIYVKLKNEEHKKKSYFYCKYYFKMISFLLRTTKKMWRI